MSAMRFYVEYKRAFSRDHRHMPSSDIPYQSKGDIALAGPLTRPGKVSAT
jgi:hypothetical protein